MIVDSKYIINLVENLERVGCHPFKFIKKKHFRKFEFYELKEFDWTSDFIQWEHVIYPYVYYKNRIDEIVINQKERDKYYKVYEKEIFPVVLDDTGWAIDGSHRLSMYKHKKLSFKAYVGIRS